MARKRFTAEQIITKLREAEVGLAQGKTVVQADKQMGITELIRGSLNKCALAREEHQGAPGRPHQLACRVESRGCVR